MTEYVRIAIVGSGFAGLGMAVRLKDAGIHDFTVLERADEVGGTRRDNRYPNCACDVPSHLYSFSFAPNPDWSRTFSGQTEIWQYLRRIADEHGIRPFIRFARPHERRVGRGERPHPVEDGGQRVDERRLPKLVPRRRWPQPHAAARVLLAIRRQTRRFDSAEYVLEPDAVTS